MVELHVAGETGDRKHGAALLPTLYAAANSGDFPDCVTPLRYARIDENTYAPAH